MSSPAHAWGSRGAVRVGGRAVHYRRLDKPGAPALVLLHGSPESASALASVAFVMKERFDVIGLDTPGNGLSQAVDTDRLTSRMLGETLIETLDAFGIQCAGVYGSHTGATIAMEAALLAPERIAGLVLDGYPVWTEAEREEMLARYLVSYPPLWDGSHLVRIWARLEEQRLFFPWYDTRDGALLDLPPTPMETRLRRLRDWLTAAETYEAVYTTAFVREGEKGPDRVEVPTLIGATDSDPLSTHLRRIERRTRTVAVERWGEDREAALQRVLFFLTLNPGTPVERDPNDETLLAALASPEPLEGWSPDEHGGFLLKMWRDLRLSEIEGGNRRACLRSRLDPAGLQRRIVSAIQAHTGL
ncbi:MAG: alpha/beta hydrolase [Oceanicaulis sp.]